MTTTDFLTRVRNISSYDLSLLRANDEAEASDESIIQNANEVLSGWAESLGMLSTNIAVTFTAGEGVYNGEGPRFSRKVHAPKVLQIDDNLPIWVIGYEQFAIEYPYWTTSAAGRPFRAGWDGINLYLYPIPDATTAALTVTLTGIYVPQINIDESSAELDIPLALHAPLAYATVARMTQHAALDNTQMLMVQKFEADSQDALQKVAMRKGAARSQGRRPNFAKFVRS